MERINGNDTNKTDQKYTLRTDAEIAQRLAELEAKCSRKLSLMDIANAFSVQPVTWQNPSVEPVPQVLTELPNKTFVILMPIAELFVDTNYHRLSIGHTKRLIETYNSTYANAITVAARWDEQRRYVLDGLHKAIAALINGQYVLPAIVHCDTSPKDEAAILIAMNEIVQPISSHAMFKASIIADDPAAIAVKNICDKYHLDTGPRKKESARTPYLAGLKTALDITKRNGIDWLDWTLHTMRNLGWLLVDTTVTNTTMLRAMAGVYRVNPNGDALEKALCSTSPEGLNKLAATIYPDSERATSLYMCLLDIVSGKLDQDKILEILRKAYETK